MFGENPTTLVELTLEGIGRGKEDVGEGEQEMV